MITDIILSSFDWKSIYFILQLIIATSAVIGILYKLLMFIFKTVKSEYGKVCKLHTMIETIYSEITPNHGTSLKDKVNTIERKLEENTQATSVIMHRQRWLLDNRDEPIFESRDDGTCTWVNDKYCKLTGYSVDDFLNNGWKSVLHEADRERISVEWESAVKDKRDSHATFRIVSKDGVVYKVRADAMRNGDGGYIGKVIVESRVDDAEGDPHTTECV